jgi:pyrroline-5-carboxylate reductase
MHSKFSEKVAFIGAGRIAEVWIERLLNSQLTDPQQIMAADIRNERLQEIGQRWNIRTSLINSEPAAFGDLLVLSVPPPETLSVLKAVTTLLRPGQIVVSLAAAVPIADLEQIAGRQPVVRVMPNTPALVGEAMNLVVFGSSVLAAERSRIMPLLDNLGKWFEVADEEVDLWCALCAVGPTFILPVIELLAAAATTRGLPGDRALQAAAQMAVGTARMIQQARRTPEQLKQMIGLRTLREDDARKLFTGAYHEAVEKLQQVASKVRAASS